MKAEIPDRKGTDDWQTPQWVLDTFARGCFDPCPLKGDGGLAINWKDPTFVNPPYSLPMPWVEKGIHENRKGIEIRFLLKHDPSTEWYEKLAAAGAHFLSFNERLQFRGPGHASSYFPSLLAILSK